jgi:hypothetical protein
MGLANKLRIVALFVSWDNGTGMNEDSWGHEEIDLQEIDICRKVIKIHSRWVDKV